VALSSECEVHNWSWSTEDDIGCPVCYGIALAEKRIIDALKAIPCAPEGCDGCTALQILAYNDILEDNE
jgi:hypothetical protein